MQINTGAGGAILVILLPTMYWCMMCYCRHPSRHQWHHPTASTMRWYNPVVGCTIIAIFLLTTYPCRRCHHPPTHPPSDIFAIFLLTAYWCIGWHFRHPPADYVLMHPLLFSPSSCRLLTDAAGAIFDTLLPTTYSCRRHHPPADKVSMQEVPFSKRLNFWKIINLFGIDLHATRVFTLYYFVVIFRIAVLTHRGTFVQFLRYRSWFRPVYVH